MAFTPTLHLINCSIKCREKVNMMLVCSCLNIKIHAQDVLPCKSRYPGLDTELSESLGEVNLESSGITFEHSYLVHRETSGQFKSFQCLCCKTHTHVQSVDGKDTVLVNTKLESDPNVIERLKRSPNYSEVFRIILQKSTEHGGSAPDPRSLDSLQTHLNQVQEQLKRFLVSEEQALEERVRHYEEEQRSEYQQLQDKAKADKRKMISVVLRAAESTEKEEKDMDFLPQNQRNLQKSSPSSKKSKKGSQMRLSSQSFSGHYHTPDSEAMFVLDEIEPLDEPFYESEDDEDISPMKTRDESSYSSKNKQELYSSSVPISVPMWGKGRHHSEEEEDEEEDGTPSDPDQIAGRMQALAESITDTGRYIFGDRPRPRMNTGEFIH